MKRKATAVWKGTGLEGTGSMSTQSGAFTDLPYSAKLRFQNEDGTLGTNPEELIAAAHAGCFAMALSFQLSNAGTPPEELRCEATLTMEKEEVGWTIQKIRLELQGRVPGVTDAQFQELAAKAKAGCPVSRLLKAEIELAATLLA
ncbi:MAG: OsmC family protein [Gemmatimonadota bacterium]